MGDESETPYSSDYSVLRTGPEDLNDSRSDSQLASPYAHLSSSSATANTPSRSQVSIPTDDSTGERSGTENTNEEDAMRESRSYAGGYNRPKNSKEPIEVRIHVMEGNIELLDLTEKEAKLALRIYLDGKCRSVLSQSQWNSTLSYRITKKFSHLQQTLLEFRLYAVSAVFRRHRLFGSFLCDLYSIYRSEQHSVVGKWLPLTSPSSSNGRNDGSEYQHGKDVCGFIKVTVCVRRLLHSESTVGIPLVGDNDDRDVLFTESLPHCTMSVRVYKLCQLDATVIDYDPPNTRLFVQVQVGKEDAITRGVNVTSDSVDVNEEVYLWLLWPTVARNVIFRILGKQRTEPLAEAVLSLSECQGNDEFGKCLPLFGPAFVNFYQVAEPDEQRAAMRYVGRALIEFDCIERDRPRERYSIIPEDEAKYASYIQGKCQYVLFGSFFDANYIHPMYGKKNISFNISIGAFGNEAYDTPSSANRTISVMPAFSGSKYYAIAWGNRKPVCEIQCALENIVRRIGRSNIINHVAIVVEKLVEVASTQADGYGHTASNICDLLRRTSALLRFIIESMSAYASWLVKLDRRTRERLSLAANTRLDSARTMVTRSKALEILSVFRRLKFRFHKTHSIIEVSIDRLRRAASLLKSLSRDPQMSIPDVLITMNDRSELLAFAKMPVTEIFYSNDRSLKGTYCGRIRSVILQQVVHEGDGTKQQPDVAAVLSLRMWFGRAIHRMKFESAIRPGRMRYVAEVFENEMLTVDGSWEHVVDNWYSDEAGTIRLTDEQLLAPQGWTFTDDAFRAALCHQTWVGLDAGRENFYDELFEVHEFKDCKWRLLNFVGRHGDIIDEGPEMKPPPGWKWQGEWIVDRTRPTDPDGWVYSKQNNFDEYTIEILDYVEHTDDRFRCRRLRRERVLVDDLAALVGIGRNIESPCWEYARTLDGPLHWQQKPDDKFRRRLVRRELKPPPIGDYASRRNMGVRIQQRSEQEDGESESTEGKRTAGDKRTGGESSEVRSGRTRGYMSEVGWRSNCLPPGIHEVYDDAVRCEMRASILWGRDLLSDVLKGRRPFVRVAFMNRCMETAVVANSVNPVWVETLIFPPVLLCRPVRRMHANPPSVVVEVRSDEMDGSEPFLGRFTTTVSTCCAHQGRPLPKWFPLHFPGGAKRGALLASFELFMFAHGQHCVLPPPPAKKKLLPSRYSADPAVCPLFAQYTIHLLCFGIRDYVSHGQLSALNTAYVEVRIGDRVGYTSTVKHLKRNPNFIRPLITLDNVVLPQQLCYAPPLTFSLHQLSPVPFISAVAACNVTSFAKYLRKVPKEYVRDEVGWSNFDRVLRDEENIEARMRLSAKEGANETIDWWSKYYASIGDEQRAPGFAESGIEKLTVFECALEEADGYREFSDFMDTFIFRELSSGKCDVSALPPPRAALRAKIYIRRKGGNSSHSCKSATYPPLETYPDSTRCLLRVYVIRAFDLVSRRSDGTCDPYIAIRCGNRKISARKAARFKDLNPIFGRMLEMVVSIPRDKNLVISVLDRHRIFSDSEVGHTEVDLEKRLFSQYRATVGLPCKYCISGPLPWRDNMSPLAILKNFCKRMHYPAPELFPIDENDAAITAFGVTYKLSEVAPKTHKRDGMLGRPLQRVALHILLQMGLVPEHVETRALHGPGGIDVVTGKLQMFVDLLPLRAGPIKPPVDISPRQPVRYQLRVVIWSVHGALLSKTSIGRKVADLYVKCFLEGAKKEERTDIHFRSTDGNASFNWRFVIDFDYDIWEEKVVFRSKKLFSRQKKEELYEPILKIEVCDNNRFQPDTLIGERYVDLREFPEAEIDDDGNPTVPTIPLQQSSCCARAGTCWKKTLCCIRKRHRELAKLPRPVLYEPKNHRSFSLFKERRTYGWWPFLSAPFTELKKMSYTALKKKNDDHTEKSRYVTANVKMELELLTQDEAEQLPVGRKRLEPNRCPYLPPPYRSSMDDHWCTSRLNAATSFCCRTYATKCFFITVTLTLLLIIAFLTIYRLPARFLKWLFGLP